MMNNPDACTINGKHTYRDYGLYVTNTNPVAPPAVRTQTITLPGRNGDLDLTDALTGYPIYGNRQLTIGLGGKKEPRAWPGFISDFLNEIHGRRVKIIFDNDPEYYYEGRATVQSDYERGNYIATFTLQVNADPYKYAINSSAEPWLWDPFSLVDGIIRNYGSITVSGETTVTVVGSPMPTIPIITASAAMTVQFGGQTYQLSTGANRISNILLMDGEYQMTFTGDGTVSIDFRAGRL